jgi:hypothetical protein
MPCKAPCFDCPYLRGSEKLEMSDLEMIDFVYEHHTEDGLRGGYDPFMCPEQGDICFGQIQMIANGYKPGLDPFSDIGEAVTETPDNTEDYFKGSWEFMVYHKKPLRTR